MTSLWFEGNNEAYEVITTWKPKSDVWAYLYGPAILSSSTAISAGYINYRFRKALKLRSFVFITTYIATTCIPATLASLLHGDFVLAPSLSGKPVCPLCLETRSIVLQTTCSTLYPLLLAPIVCFQFADRYMTAVIPPLWPEPKLLLKKYLSIVKPMSRNICILTAFNIALGAGIAYGQHMNLVKVSEELQRMEATLTPERRDHLKQRSEREDNSVMRGARPKWPWQE
ncbi:uncharacterized protein LOC108677054 [Hyalella azteca]|uniref:Uncharacterized protein LOC108677054 n=1 Tax=Hyalella azteca TaxID=294128 RepID=A0A8B7P3K0_HYAAZ|nr:uncharacterized protein LOC108677054 [Hyalella azteca]